MIYVGIDYGSKRIGVAASDPEGCLAFPLTVLRNDKELLPNIKKIMEDRETISIVLGESKDYKGNDNEIMNDMREFKLELENLGYKIFFEPEFMTSAEAAHLQSDSNMLDASAAAILLQSFLDKERNKS